MSGVAETGEGPRGGAPVGYLKELTPLEASAVIYMRLWFSGPERQGDVWNDFATQFGSTEGAKRLKAFERLMAGIIEAARRPILRHQLRCACLGADEAVFANLIAASAGETGSTLEDATLFAALLVRPDMAMTVALRARAVSASLSVLCGALTPAPGKASPPPLTHPLTTTRH